VPGLAVVFAGIRKKAQARIDARCGSTPPRRSDPRANFFGQRSRGPAQVRGNGGLALTEDALWFGQLVPERDLEIPLSAVRGVHIERSFMGKTKGGPIVVVDFDLGEGEDAAGWMVRDAESWSGAIEDAAG